MATLGRPTKYDPAMCARVVEMMAEGCSRVEVCADLGICYETFQRWQESHPDFSESVKRGLQACQAWWEREGRTNLKDRDFSYTGWYMNMKNRFGWKDKQETTISGELDLNTLTDDQLEFRIVELAAKTGIVPVVAGEGTPGEA